MIGSFDQSGHNNYKFIVKLCLVLVINSVKKFVKFRRSYFTFLSKRTYQLCLGLGVKPISGPKTSALSKFNPEVGVAHLLRIKTLKKGHNHSEERSKVDKRTVRRSEGQNYISLVIRHSSA